MFLGLDVSTTAVKALLVDAGGRVRASASTPLDLSFPKPLWSEQAPGDWWKAAVRSLRRIPAKARARIQAVGLTGQMHGLVLLDAKGRVLRPAILWNDQRALAECEEIRSRLPRKRLIRIAGNDALTGFTAPKILWVRRHEPGVYAKVRHLLLPKDYIRARLTGDYAMDKADGSGTLLFDLKKREWSPEVLDALGIPRAWLPPVFEGAEITGKVGRRAAEETGLPMNTPVVAGAGDQAAQAAGVGVIAPGRIALTVGTSGVVFAPTDRPLVEPDGRLHAFCHVAPGYWHLMGVMLSAAGSLQWYRDTMAPGVSFDALLREAARVPPGSEGLLFLPYLSGERTPHPDPDARGAWVGLTLRHTRGYLTRALLEGVAFGLKDCLALVEGMKVPIREVRASGGGMQSPLWRQILADVLERKLMTVNATEGAAYGAALLAGVSQGAWKDVQIAAEACVRVVATVCPTPARAAVYRRCHEDYRALYPALKAFRRP